MYNEYGINMINIMKKMEEERNLLKHPFVGSEHLILAILKHDDKVSNVFNKFNVTYDTFKKELIKIVGIPKKNVGFNLYTPLLKRIINNAILFAEERNIKEITNEDLIISILDEGDGVAIRILMGMNIDIDDLYNSFNIDIKDKNVKNIEFGKNLNEEVIMDEKVIGRDKEVSFIIETLLRKKKNNPLLIGDAGVGKTAIVEELARLINDKKVPKKLLNSKIISIEMGNIVSGTKYRGEFEEKLEKIIKELEANDNIILFIDEIHTMVSAGGADGAISAGDIFKPYLARGNVKCIGATTTEEYDKYIAKDKALARRFEKIIIKEPNKLETIEILNKIKEEYEIFHNVKISKSNIDLIVDLADKYIFDKNNPDKSIDFLDSVCTSIKVSNDNNKLIYKCYKELENIKREKDECIYNNKFKEATNYSHKELKLINKIDYLNKNYITKIKDKDIYKVLSNKSKVPVLIDKNNLLNKLKKEFDKKLDNDNYDSFIKGFENKLLNMNKILGFLFVSKTDIKDIIESVNNVFEHNINYIKINGEDYTSDASISKLIGSYAGYVGYNDASIFNNIKYNPYALIYITNFNKMSSSVKNLFKNILDEGYIIDAKGNKINFSNTIIIANIINNNKKQVGFISSDIKDDNYLEEDCKNKFNQIININ